MKTVLYTNVCNTSDICYRHPFRLKSSQEQPQVFRRQSSSKWNMWLFWVMDILWVERVSGVDNALSFTCKCFLHACVCVCVCTYVHACVCVCACVSLEALLRLERRNLHHGVRPVWVSFLVRLPHSPSSTHPLNSQSFTESISPPKNCFRNQLSIFKKSCSTPTTVLHRPNTIGPATV